MPQIPPSRLPAPGTDLPATPTVIPKLPTRLPPDQRAPLPDAVAIRPCSVPPTAPPFDDEENGNGAVPPARGDPPDEGRGAAANADVATAVSAVAAPAETQQRPPGPPADWPSKFAQVVAETLAGSRPTRQLTPWTTEEARKRIRQLGPMLATGHRPTVRRVMTSAPAANVLEMTAVVGFGPRVRVLALRLELAQPRAYRQGGIRWCCTAIETA